MAVNANHRLRQIDSKILDLLEERAMVTADLAEEEEETESAAEIAHWWVEEATERGLDDEASVERVCKAVLLLCKSAER